MKKSLKNKTWVIIITITTILTGLFIWPKQTIIIAIIAIFATIVLKVGKITG